MKKILSIVAATMMLFTACKKADLAGNDPTGEGLVGFTLKAPVSSTKLQLNSAAPTTAVEFTWNASKPGLTTAPTYTVVFALKTGGDLNTPLISFPADNSGKATKLTVTHKQIDDALAAKSIVAAASTDLIWSVQADNEDVKILATSSFNITITRFGDGATTFFLLGPTSSKTNMEINPSSTTDILKFNWTKSRPATGGPAIKYKVVFAKVTFNAVTGEENPVDWTTPLFSVASNNAGTDSLASISYKQISDSLTSKGLTDPSVIAKLKWTAVATSGNFSLQSAYVNDIYLARLVRMYIVGSPTGWDINAPYEIVADKRDGRLGKVFYTYMKLNAGDEFKFAKEVGNWGSCFGNNGASGAGFSTGYNVGGNFVISTAGIYRLTVDLGTNMAYIQQKQVGLVGGLQGWNPAAPVNGGYVARDKFLIVAPSAATDEFKFHDGTGWDNNTPDQARYWGLTNGVLVEPGADNIHAEATRTRAIWDGTNPQSVTYIKNSAAQMRVVGDGMNQAGVNDWDPASSPQMTYAGNGIWTITIALKAGKEIKFLAGDAWGAFDYEDNSGQSSATGTARPIKWDGSNNFKTPATAGIYTITLNEFTQTVTIN